MATRRRICRIQVLDKNSPFLANSSTRQNGHFRHFGRTRYIRRHSPTCFGQTQYIRRHSPTKFARTLQTSESQVLQVLHEFGKSGEFGEFSECRLDRFIHIKYVICAQNDLSCLRRHSPTCFGRTRYIRQPILPGLDTFVDIRQPTLPGLARLAHIRQRAFLRKM